MYTSVEITGDMYIHYNISMLRIKYVTYLAKLHMVHISSVFLFADVWL